jgi:predicted hotdog family 3-hydroxylacyl-ACP dehydratase
MSDSSFPPIEQMLPHRHPFLFIESVLDVMDDRIVCRAMVEKGHYLTCGEEAPLILGIEMGAQAAGVLAALQHHRTESTDSPPKVGYLVGIRQARFHAKALPVGCALRVEATDQGASGPLGTFGIRVSIEGDEETLVEARISTWAAAEEPKPLS